MACSDEIWGILESLWTGLERFWCLSTAAGRWKCKRRCWVFREPGITLGAIADGSIMLSEWSGGVISAGAPLSERLEGAGE